MWLRQSSFTDIFFRTGSNYFFGSGLDNDFLIYLNSIPDEFHEVLPAPYCSPESPYGDSLIVIKDPHHPTYPADYIIGEPHIIDEYRFATEQFVAMCRDPSARPETIQKLQEDKLLRVTVFRALRHAYPTSTLTH
jgi:hypothetical protein